MSANDDTRIRDLRTRLLGGQTTDPLAQISWRDAAERVDQLSFEDQAVRLLRHAFDNADEPLTRTILRAAIDQHWAGVVDLYAATHHRERADLEALWALTHEHSLPHSDHDLIKN